MGAEIDNIAEAVKKLEAIGEGLEDAVNAAMPAFALAGAKESALQIAEDLEKTSKRSRGALGLSYIQNVSPIETKKTKASAATESPLPYAGIQQEGGDIGPGPKLLAIPLAEAHRDRHPRDFPGLVFFISKKGNKLLGIPQKGDGPPSIKPVFVLKEQVTIPAKGYLERAATAALEPIEDQAAKIAEGILAKLASEVG